MLCQAEIIYRTAKKSLEDKDKKLFSELSIEHPQDHSTEIKTILERISQIRTECIQKNDQLYSLQNEAKKMHYV